MVFGLFSKDKNSGVAKTVERATNKLAQQADRMAALDKLRDDGTEESLLGLCKRWSVTSSKGVEDEYEKTWVVDSLVGHGAAAWAPLQKYMKSAEQLSFALRAMERIAHSPSNADNTGKVPAADALVFVDELLASEPPGYTRHPERRIDLIRWLAEWKAASSEQTVPRLAPYLADFDENVRFAAIDGLSAHDAALIAAPIAAALAKPDEESGRIRRTLAELIASKKLPLGDSAQAVAAVLTGPLTQFRVENGTLASR
jgi:HEAT repeat protein